MILLTCSGAVSAQEEGTSVFNFLSLPSSAHSMALGGTSVSMPDDDASLFFFNPALMANVEDRTLNLGFLTYMQGCKMGNVSFVKAAGKRGTWALGAKFLGYGSMQETTVEGISVGQFRALDMLLTGGYTYMLGERWAGGVTTEFIYSKYASYTSIALAASLGLNYYNQENDFSFSLVASHLGGQVKAFADTHERLPYDLSVGFTKRLAEAPIRFTVTMTDLTRWSSDYFYNPEHDEKFGKILLNHFQLGVDIIPSSFFHLSAGFNFRRASEMKSAGSSHGSGLSFGAGVHVKRFRIDLAYSKYHVSTPGLMFNAQVRL
ncbi:MAG: type IX secretion system protein PorQ [Bacteroidaceae bacterium]|nr:type IX secretion system protein PorQ [Bacteroidaceae bacterium]